MATLFVLCLIDPALSLTRSSTAQLVFGPHRMTIIKVKYLISTEREFGNKAVMVPNSPSHGARNVVNSPAIYDKTSLQLAVYDLFYLKVKQDFAF